MLPDLDMDVVRNKYNTFRLPVTIPNTVVHDVSVCSCCHPAIPAPPSPTSSLLLSLPALIVLTCCRHLTGTRQHNPGYPLP